VRASTHPTTHCCFLVKRSYSPIRYVHSPPDLGVRKGFLEFRRTTCHRGVAKVQDLQSLKGAKLQHAVIGDLRAIERQMSMAVN
jgi:hypothetical protein